MFASFRDAVNRLHVLYNNITLDTVLHLEKPKSKTLQKMFTDLQSKPRVQHFKDSIATDLKHLAWFSGLQNADSGAWISAIPKTQQMVIHNEEYTVMFCYRFYLPQPHVTTNVRCPGHGFVDPLGHHLITKCGHDGQRQVTHNAITHVIQRILSMNGIRSRYEDITAFRGSDPNTNMKPDILIPVQGFTEKANALDVSICAPDAGVHITNRNQAERQGAAANHRFTAKQTKYSTIAERNRLRFLPIIMESTGFLHPGVVKLLRAVRQYGSALDRSVIPLDVTVAYMRTLISVTLQRYLAQSLLHRVRKLHGGSAYNNATEERSAYHARNVFEYDQNHTAMDETGRDER